MSERIVDSPPIVEGSVPPNAYVVEQTKDYGTDKGSRRFVVKGCGVAAGGQCSLRRFWGGAGGMVFCGDLALRASYEIPSQPNKTSVFCGVPPNHS